MHTQLDDILDLGYLRQTDVEEDLYKSISDDFNRDINYFNYSA